MNIIELIQKAGPENIKVQNVASSLVSMKHGRRDAEVTFATEPAMGSAAARESAGLPSTHIGLIVWIPRDKLLSA
jgi:hypothetical protein